MVKQKSHQALLSSNREHSLSLWFPCILVTGKPTLITNLQGLQTLGEHQPTYLDEELRGLQSGLVEV